jgi:hypothetical protein
MAEVRDDRSPFGRQLVAYGEFWKKDHHAAMNCRDWEEAIALGLSLYQFHREREELWREQVYRGVVPFSDQDDETYRIQLKGWLEVADEVLRDCLPGLEREFGTVEGAAQLRSDAADARIRLDQWSPPRITQSIGLREMTLSPEAAAQLDRMIEEAKTNPPPPLTGPVPRSISAEEFLRSRARV